LRRREFIAGLGAAAAWPLAARAQQPVIPVVGFLHRSSPDAYAERLRGFRQGLKESGYAEGENVAIVYRWAENQLDRLPDLAAELVRRRVAVIVAPQGMQPVWAAMAATKTIPIVFSVGEDPVRCGLGADPIRSECQDARPHHAAVAAQRPRTSHRLRHCCSASVRNRPEAPVRRSAAVRPLSEENPTLGGHRRPERRPLARSRRQEPLRATGCCWSTKTYLQSASGVGAP
jgi:hypothetical protein